MKDLARKARIDVVENGYLVLFESPAGKAGTRAVRFVAATFEEVVTLLEGNLTKPRGSEKSKKESKSE